MEHIMKCNCRIYRRWWLSSFSFSIESCKTKNEQVLNEKYEAGYEYEAIWFRGGAESAGPKREDQLIGWHLTAGLAKYKVQEHSES